MTTLGGIDRERGTFRVYMTCLDLHFTDTVKVTVPVRDREWNPKENTWTFAIRHLDTIKRILEFPKEGV